MATQTRKRTDYLVEIGQNNVVFLKAIKASISDIAAALGYTEDSDGEVPQNKTLVGTTQEEALLAGCFPIAIYYRKNKKTQRAIVLCSPNKADTVAQELRNKKYANCPIVKVRPPARRKITFR